MSAKISRNASCPCGSNKKYKQCCLHKQTRTADHTPEGKFKFSATLLKGDESGERSFSIFQKVSASLATSQGSELLEKFNHSISKNKAGVGKRTVRSIKAKEDREIRQKLQQHSFEKMDVSI